MRTTEGPAHVLFGRTRREVLGWLLTHPGDSFFLRQIARHVRLAASSVQRELDLLVKAGLVNRVDAGRQVNFSANEASPLYRELQSIFIKTTGVADVLRSALRPVKRQIVTAVLVGPAAGGELQNKTPLNLVVVGSVAARELEGSMARAQKALGRVVTARAVPSSQLARLMAEPHVVIMKDGGEARTK
jgi:hypothetical protein